MRGILENVNIQTKLLPLRHEIYCKWYIHLVTQLYILLLLDIVYRAGPLQKPNIMWYASGMLSKFPEFWTVKLKFGGNFSIRKCKKNVFVG